MEVGIIISIAVTWLALWPVVFICRRVIDVLIGVYWGATLPDHALELKLFSVGLTPPRFTTTQVTSLLTMAIWASVYWVTR